MKLRIIFFVILFGLRVADEEERLNWQLNFPLMRSDNEKRGGEKKQWRLRNCGNTTEATTLLQQFIKKRREKKKTHTHSLSSI